MHISIFYTLEKEISQTDTFALFDLFGLQNF